MSRRAPQSVATTIVPVRSLRHALRIYAYEELGLELIRLERHHATFRDRRSGAEVVVKEAPSRATLELVVDDLNWATSAIFANGGTINLPLESFPVARTVVCEDGDGNRLELRRAGFEGGAA